MITGPQSLLNADATIDIAEALVKLIDPKERQRISDDIKAFHALNDTEAKQASEARVLIKRNADILKQNQETEERIAKVNNDLQSAQAQFEIDKKNALDDIATKQEEHDSAMADAVALSASAQTVLESVKAKELQLAADRSAYEIDVKKLGDDLKALDKRKKEIEAFKQQVLALNSQTEEKLSSLKQFNF